MSGQDFKNKHPDFFQGLLAVGLLASPDARRMLFGRRMSEEQMFTELNGKYITNAETHRKLIAERETHGLDFSVRTIQENGSDLQGYLSQAIQDLYRSLSSNQRFDDSLVTTLDFKGSAWAKDASDYVDDFILSKKQGKTWTDVINGKAQNDAAFKLYYPKEKQIVFLKTGLRPFTAIQTLVTELKRKARGDMIRVQGGTLTKEVTVDKRKQFVEVETPTGGKGERPDKLGKPITNLDTIRKATKYKYLPEIVFWLNGVLDISAAFVGKTEAQQTDLLKKAANVAGRNLGHDIGIQAGLAAPVIQYLARSAPAGSTFKTELDSILSDIQQELRVELSEKLNETTGFHDSIHFLVFETGKSNTEKGAETKINLNKITNLFLNDKSFRRFVRNYLDVPGSGTKFQKINKYFEEGFEKNNWIRISNKGKLNFSTKIKAPKTKISSIKMKSPKVKTTTTVEEDSASTASQPNLAAILKVLNDKLEGQLKLNMGKGNAPKRLNWRTGRFARSAEILALLPTRGESIQAQISYLRNPYDVFLPGGKLHNELRDPEKLIGKSIRQILSENLGVTTAIRTRLV